MQSDTIFALSTAAGRAGLAVLRVSGPCAGQALQQIAGAKLPEPRKAALRLFKNAHGDQLDHGLALWFPGPASFTGEDCAEFHIHGGRAIVEAMLAALSAIKGLRPAEAGEFTRRAVEHGRLDLTRAEALADLIDAQTEAQRRQALRQYDGGLYNLYEGWRSRLIASTAWAEAAIDFSDEELPEDVLARARAGIGELYKEIQLYMSDGQRGQLVRDGLFLTVIGAPNAGKSSLVNALAKRDVAIVSDIAGTTRDIIEVQLNLDGYLVTISDTAGLRRSEDVIEQEGVRRALERAEYSDLLILMRDGAAGQSPMPQLTRKPDLILWNKADLAGFEKNPPFAPDEISLSLKTGQGMEEFIRLLRRKVAEKLDKNDEAPPITRLRHRLSLTEALASLSRALIAEEPELMAEDLRLALRHIGRITGKVDVEDLLDVIFRDFCIGK